MKCKYCQGVCIKKGWYKTVQKYRCVECGKYQRSLYRIRRYTLHTEQQVRLLNNECVGISSMSRILQIPKSSVQMLVLRAASKVTRPMFSSSHESYEVDEMYTFIGSKNTACYIVYAINRKTRQVFDFITGSRSKEQIGGLIRRLLLVAPAKIYTDRLNIYKSLVPRSVHRTFQYMTNRIERMNLTLRTHLKRLVRRGICFSRSAVMLEACLKLYMWGKSSPKVH
ncbi:IS1 family transposase [Filimonas lacunae]